jgi:hypothetical protein
MQRSWPGRGTRTIRSFRIAFVAAGLNAGFAMGDISENVFTITAENAHGVGSYVLRLSDTGWDRSNNDGVFRWTHDDPIALIDANTDETVATLEQFSLFYRADPQISMSYSVRAGDDTTAFVIESGLLSFPKIDNADGQANASFTLADSGDDGALLDGATGPDADRAYWALVNGSPPDATTFTALIESLEVPPGGGTRAITDSDPPFGYREIAVSVESMSVESRFTITPYDQASATTNFEVIPEPSSGVLLCAAALALLRRR